MRKKSILIVEDEPEMRKVLFEGLSSNGYSISLSESAETALPLFDQKPFDLVISDIRLPDRDGLQLLDALKERSPQTPVMLMTGFGTIQNAVEAMRKGAFDYLVKPFPIEQLEQRIKMVFHEGPVSIGMDSRGEDPSVPPMPIITQDKRMKDLIELCQKIAATRATVLIQGESGTGKELFARYLHHQSPRRKGPFIAVNCASLPEPLFESELFGHEKGAFTGALNRKLGKFELAHHGTILLDEISEMSPFLQAKILRVLEENEVDRVGGREPIPLDIRVIATTNRNLEACIEKGEFREDLYYRLNVINIRLPPLRERVEDIELLTRNFIKNLSALHGKPVRAVSDSALLLLKGQLWRGNVRELKNQIERALLITSESEGELRDLSGEVKSDDQEKGSNDLHSLSLREMEKNMIFKALEKMNGNRTHAAEILGISIRTLRNKLNEYKENLAPLGRP